MSEQRQRRSKAVTTSNASFRAYQQEWVEYDQTEVEIDLIDLLYGLLENWKLILCLCMIGVIITGLFTVYVITPQYKATSIIYVLGNSDSAINLSDLQIGNALTQDYVKVFQMWEVHEEVISELGLPYTYNEMKDMLSVTNDADTRMIDITITSPNPQEAAAIANEYAKVVSQFIADTMSTDKPNIMSVALTPSNPSSPNLSKNVLLGFVAGAFVACAYVFIRFMLDDKLKTTDEIHKYTGLTTLAIIYKERTDQTQNVRRHP